MQGMTHPLVIRESRWPSHVPAKSFAGVSSTYHRWPWAWTNSKLLVPKNNWPFNICQCLCFCTRCQIWWSKLSLIHCEEAHQLLMTILMSVNHPTRRQTSCLPIFCQFINCMMPRSGSPILQGIAHPIVIRVW